MREGLLAEYVSEDALIAALKSLRAHGYRELDALSPYGSERVIEALALPRSPIPIAMLIAGALSGAAGYAGLYWTRAVDAAWNSGGRPLHAAPAFVPITFELTILGAVLAGAITLVWLCRLPSTSHPLLSADTGRASDDRFFAVVSADDAVFDPERTRAHLGETHPQAIRPFGASSPGAA